MYSNSNQMILLIGRIKHEIGSQIPWDHISSIWMQTPEGLHIHWTTNPTEYIEFYGGGIGYPNQ